MEKKLLKNKLNSQKGISSGDIIIALLIIITTLGVIMMIYQNLVIGGKEVDRKTGATRLAVNMLENMDTLFYDEFENELKSLTDSGYATTNDNINYIIIDTKAFNTTIPKGYQVRLNVEDVGNFGLVRKVTITVEYNENNQKEDVTLSKVMEKEIVRECNSPQFTEEYIRQMIPIGTQYIMYSNVSSGIATDTKVICPIKYDGSLKKYKIVDDISSIWYSYSSKNWARIVIIEANLLSTYINDSDKTIQNEEILTGENSYVWIPRFGIENGKEPLGGTKFKYKATDLAILNNYGESTLNTNYIDINNSVEWSARGISFDNNELVGVWSRYSTISELSSDAYFLNESQYGPIAEY